MKLLLKISGELIMNIENRFVAINPLSCRSYTPKIVFIPNMIKINAYVIVVISPLKCRNYTFHVSKGGLTFAVSLKQYPNN